MSDRGEGRNVEREFELEKETCIASLETVNYNII